MNTKTRKFLEQPLQKTIAFVAILSVAYLSVVGILLHDSRFAQANVTNITGQDNDNEVGGINGEDITLSWTVTGQPTDDFTGRLVYLFPEATDISGLTAANIDDDFCGGFGCTSLMTIFDYHIPQLTMFPYHDNFDSEANTFAQGNYNACILTTDFNPANNHLACTSSVFALTSEADTLPPFVEHEPADKAFDNTLNDIVVHAIVKDDVTVDFTAPGASLSMFYSDDLESSATEVVGSNVSGDLFEFPIAASGNDLPAYLQTGQTFEYYIHAVDEIGNEFYACESEAQTQEACEANPFTVEVVDPGANQITGTVTDEFQFEIQDAYVLPANLAVSAVQTDPQGDYTITSIPDNTPIEIFAFLDSYCGLDDFLFIESSDQTKDFELRFGDCQFEDGEHGNEGPRQVFSFPPMHDNHVPTNLHEIGIRIGFDRERPLDRNSIIPGEFGNVYLVDQTDDSIVASQIRYCEDDQDSTDGCDALFDNDENVILVTPDAELDPNNPYKVFIGSSVSGENGLPVEGNRDNGGHELLFSTGGGTFTENDIETHHGNRGDFMPPFVEGAIPRPGDIAPINTPILMLFNQPMDTTTLTDTYIKIFDDNGQEVSTTIEVDQNTRRAVTITPDANLAANTRHKVQVLGGVSSASGVPFRSPQEDDSHLTQVAFENSFNTSSGADAEAPSVFAELEEGATGVSVATEGFEFGFSETIHPQTMNGNNIEFTRDGESVSFDIDYDPGLNRAFVIPNSALVPQTEYVITFTTSVTDITGNALASDFSLTFTTGASDNTEYKVKDVTCNDHQCRIEFTKRLNDDPDSADSILNSDNVTIKAGDPLAAVDLSGKPFKFDPPTKSLTINNMGLTIGDDLQVTISDDGALDIAGNTVDSTGDINVIDTVVKTPAETYGEFEEGMFRPGFNDEDGIGGRMINEGHGNFTADQHARGLADEAFPFNDTASQEVDVMHIRFVSQNAVSDGDFFEFEFQGGDISAAVPDDFSPHFENFREGRGDVAVNFDATFDDDGVEVDTETNTVTVKTNVSGLTEAGDVYIVDLRKIINPRIPRDYTVGIKHISAAGVELSSTTTTPYTIRQGGTNTINIDVQAVDDEETPVAIAGADGEIFLEVSNPKRPPRHANFELNEGLTDNVDGFDADELALENVQDGCYFIRKHQYIADLTVGDFFTDPGDERVCVSGGQTVNYTVYYVQEAGIVNMPITIELDGTDTFSDIDMDVGISCPGEFVVKTLEDVDVNDSTTLRIRTGGNCQVGVRPALKKTAQFDNIPETSNIFYPEPSDMKIDVAGTEIAPGFFTTPEYDIDDATDTVTISFSEAEHLIEGKIVDNEGNGLRFVEVNVKGDGASKSSTFTDEDGNFEIYVGEDGVAELEAKMFGALPSKTTIRVEEDGADVGDDSDIFHKNEQITDLNEFEIKVKKESLYISGKTLDEDNNPIPWMPVVATSDDGKVIHGFSDENGNYTVYTGAGTFDLRGELPPDKTDSCSAYTLEDVVVAGESQTLQNITPTETTCATLEGDVTVDGNELENKFIAVMECVDGEPVEGGLFKPTITDEDGHYEIDVADDADYCIRTFDPTYGMLETEGTVDGDTTVDLTQADTETITFTFTGGTADMKAFIDVSDVTDPEIGNSTQATDLTEDVTITVPDGNHKYFVNVVGILEEAASVPVTNEITIDLSNLQPNTISGTVLDDSAGAVKALVVAENEDGLIFSTTSASDGTYSIDLAPGTYDLNASLDGYITEILEDVDITEADATDQDFTLIEAPYEITGTIYESDGSTEADEGSVTCENEDGIHVVAEIEPDGTYSCQVNDGDWTVKGKADGHDPTEEEVTVAGADNEDNDVTLDEDAEKVSVSTSKSLSGNAGGSIEDPETGISFTADGGVLGSGSVNLTMEKNFTAPHTSKYVPLCDMAFSIEARSTNGEIEDFNNFADIEIEYTDDDLTDCLPEGVEEGDLKLAYLAEGKDEYVLVEGGFGIDEDSNKIFGEVDHLTDFVVVSSGGSGGGGGGVGVGGGNNGGGSGGSGGGGNFKTVSVGATDSDSNSSDEDDSDVDLSGSPFTDTVGHWAESYVVELYEMGVINGKSETEFDPNSEISRAAFTKIMVNLFDYELPSDVEGVSELFSDVDSDDWYAAYVITAYERGMVKGYEDGTFRPNDDIKRVEAIKILLEAAEILLDTEYEISYPDVDMDAWYADYVRTATKRGIVKGYSDGTFGPSKSLTRAEAAKIAVETYNEL